VPARLLPEQRRRVHAEHDPYSDSAPLYVRNLRRHSRVLHAGTPQDSWLVAASSFRNQTGNAAHFPHFLLLCPHFTWYVRLRDLVVMCVIVSAQLSAQTEDVHYFHWSGVLEKFLERWVGRWACLSFHGVRHLETDYWRVGDIFCFQTPCYTNKYCDVISVHCTLLLRAICNINEGKTCSTVLLSNSKLSESSSSPTVQKALHVKDFSKIFFFHTWIPAVQSA
jgi:hypothetical protein